jgi:hypothetical protein
LNPPEVEDDDDDERAAGVYIIKETRSTGEEIPAQLPSRL